VFSIQSNEILDSIESTRCFQRGLNARLFLEANKKPMWLNTLK